MAELIIPTGFWNATVLFGGTAQPRGAATSFAGIVGAAHETPEEVGDTLVPLLTTLHEAIATSNCSITGLLVKFGPNDTGPFHERSLSIPGDQATDSPPTQVCLGLKKGTALGGHANRGRMFWPCPPENNVQADGTFDAGAITQFATAASVFLGALDTALIPMHLLHSAPGDTPEEVTSLGPALRTYTQRRRNRG